MNATPGPSRTSQSCPFIDLTEESSPELVASSIPTKSSVLNLDEDYLLALKLDAELNGPREENSVTGRPARGASPEPMEVDEAPGGNTVVTRTNSGQRGAPVSATVPPVLEDQEEIPFEETYYAHVLALLSSSGENPESCKLFRDSEISACFFAGHNTHSHSLAGPDSIQARCLVCHFSISLPGSGSFEAAFDDMMDGFAAYGVRRSL